MNHPTVPLADWLADLRRRGCTLTIQDGAAITRGMAARDDDRHHVARYRHALTVAASRTHEPWWAAVRQGGDGTGLTVDQLPWSADGFACACCGAPSTHLGPDLLAFCPDHRQAA